MAQANKEARLELVIAAEHDPASTILPFSYQSTFQKPTHIKAVFKKSGTSSTNLVKYDLSQAVATLNGNLVNLLDYMNAWVTEAMNESMLTFPSGTLVDGTYQGECVAERTFAEGLFIVNDVNIGAAKITVQFEIDLMRPQLNHISR